MALLPGSPAPLFKAKTHSKPDFVFGSLGGLFVLLLFLPRDKTAQAHALQRLKANRPLFDDKTHTAFCVVAEADTFDGLRPELPGLRYFHDEAAQLARLFDVADEAGNTAGQWILIDPSLRIFACAPLDRGQEIIELARRFTCPDDHAQTPLHAPVLVVPRIFEPEFCKHLIEVYRQNGGTPSGVMREVDGKTVAILDAFKRRSDAHIEDEALKYQILGRIGTRLLPQIEKAFMFKATRMERYIVSRYDALEGGYFRPHRDNTTKGTAHRQFACSINLNAEEFEGGDLRFPEFGQRTYRPPTGGAIVFSCSLLHEATPVTKGERFAFLPFFYNEDAAQIREANAAFLADART
jgi:predicted 2-oxoglutarate/Fe(II)-dependent dioxygenase YbiX